MLIVLNRLWVATGNLEIDVQSAEPKLSFDVARTF